MSITLVADESGVSACTEQVEIHWACLTGWEMDASLFICYHVSDYGVEDKSMWLCVGGEDLPPLESLRGTCPTV